MTMTEDVNSYDEVPYQSVALVETHPERLAAIASLFGVESPPVETARILELGCAGAGNLLPLAEAMPHATFVGVDLSPRQIDDARKAAEAGGITNVTFQVASISDLNKDFGEFDYIICHGVYSWVPDEVKASILRVLSQNLSPNGLAYLSYNTYPGWHIPGMVREMMLYHVRNLTDPGARVKGARALLDFLGNNVPDREGHYAKVLRDEAEQLKPHADSYVLHEHLEDLNHPLYFHEFAARAAEHELKVLGDSRVWSMALSAQPAVSAVLDRLSRDPVGREQYHDFLCNRRFRRSILCRADREIPGPSTERIRKLRASAAVWPTTVPTDFASRASIDFRGADGLIRLSTIDPVFKTALLCLVEAFPRSLGFDELWSLTKTRLARAGAEVVDHPDVLAGRLLQAYGANALELHTFEPPFPAEPSEKPRALAMARLAAEAGNSVPNYRHRQTNLSDFDRLVIRQLDGIRTHPEIVERLVDAVVDGSFAIQDNGLPLKDPTSVRPILERSLPPSLARLNRGALLVS